MLARNLLSAIFRVNKGKHKTANIYDIKRGFSKRTVHHIKSLLGTNNGASCHQQRCLLFPLQSNSPSPFFTFRFSVPKRLPFRLVALEAPSKLSRALNICASASFFCCNPKSFFSADGAREFDFVPTFVGFASFCTAIGRLLPCPSCPRAPAPTPAPALAPVPAVAAPTPEPLRLFSTTKLALSGDGGGARPNPENTGECCVDANFRL